MKLVVRLAWISIPLVLILYGYKVWTKTGYTDFEVYYRAAQQFASGQFDRIYDASSGASPFRYAPWNLPLFAPLALVPFAVSRLLWFVVNAAGFAWGYRALLPVVRTLVSPARVPVVMALAYLGTLRFMLDCFTIGQVTGIMFAALATATASYALGGAPLRMGAGIFVPASLKLGSALQLLFPITDFLAELWVDVRTGVQKSGETDERTPTLQKCGALASGFFLPLFALLLVTGLWIALHASEGPQAIRMLFAHYREVSAATFASGNSAGADVAALNAHYGSQSLLSALLRLSANGILERETAERLWMISGSVALLLLAGWSLLRRAWTVRARLERWSLGILVYLLWMPFQFKYGYPLLGIPVLALLCAPWPLGRGASAALGIGVLTLSLAGLDLYGETLFFALQKHSVPVWTTLFLALALAYRHVRESGLPVARELHWRTPLQGPTLELRPLMPTDFEALFAVASDPLIWADHPDRERYTRERFEKYFQSALTCDGAYTIWFRAAGENGDSELIGSSRFTGAEKGHVEIGYTFIARKFWGTGVNLELKTLMLAHAFQAVDRVYFVVGEMNLLSQRAVTKLGAERLTGSARQRALAAIPRDLSTSVLFLMTPDRLANLLTLS